MYHKSKIMAISVFALLLLPQNIYASTSTTCSNILERSFDGSCNNLIEVDKGKKGTDFSRLSCEELIDPITAPNTRQVSNEVFSDPNEPDFPFNTEFGPKVPSSAKINALFNAFGEAFVAEIAFKRRSGDPNDASLIPLPPNDPLLPLFGTFPFQAVSGTIYNGTEVCDESGDAINRVLLDATAWVDANIIYPADASVYNNLRTFSNGQLRVRESGLFPTFLDTGNPVRPNPLCDAFKNENYADFGTDCIAHSLQYSLLFLFYAEHNRYAKELAHKYPKLSDQVLFNLARKHVTATLQNIYYNEYLPILIGKRQAKQVRKEIEHYDPSIIPNASLEYNVAIQFGHDTQQNLFNLIDKDGIVVEQQTPGQFIFSPNITQFMEDRTTTYGEDVIDLVIRGSLNNPAFEIDGAVDNIVRNIFVPPSALPPTGIILDVVSIAMQRPRLDGIADYHSTRVKLDMPIYGVAAGCPVPANDTNDDPLACFLAVTPDNDVASTLKSLYGRLDNVDLFTAGMLEQPHGDGLVGITFNKLITLGSTQFGKADRLLEIRGGEAIHKPLSLKKLIELNTNVQVNGNPFKFDEDDDDNEQ